MAKFVNNCLFNPTLGGTTDWTVSGAVSGYMSPSAAGAVNGLVYKYRAESLDLSQWEYGEGTWNSGTGVLSRTTVLQNSAGNTSKINFTTVPVVGIVLGREDIPVVYVQDTPPTALAENALWWESDTGTLYVWYNDGTSSQWVAIANGAWLAGAVQYDQAQSLSFTQKAQARANIDVLKKNYIVNGAMMVSQENGSTSATTNNYYAVDQFLCNFSNGGTASFAQVASTTPAGSPNRARVTVTAADAAVAAGDYYMLLTNIEGLRAADLLFGTASAKTITIQFGVKAPAGTYCVTVLNATPNRSYVAEYVISGGEANTDVIKSVTIPGDTSGTWLKDNGIGLQVRWGLMAGSTFQQAAGAWSTGNAIGSSNQFNFMGTLSNVFELFDVSLTEGSAAPAFQVPEYASELLTAQRYYEKGNVRIIGATSGAGNSIASVRGFAANKRAAPTITTSGFTNNANATGVSGVSAGTTTDITVGIVVSAGSTNTDGAYNWAANARL